MKWLLTTAVDVRFRWPSCLPKSRCMPKRPLARGAPLPRGCLGRESRRRRQAQAQEPGIWEGPCTTGTAKPTADGKSVLQNRRLVN